MIGKIVVIGADGQDGSLLCETLAAAGRQVWAIGRRADIFCPSLAPGKTHYRMYDLAEPAALPDLLATIEPDHIVHSAAVHGPAGFDYESRWHASHMVNVASLHAVLEYARKSPHRPGVTYFSSAKIFGDLVGTVSEDSPLVADCLYSMQKIHGGNLIRYYREEHAVRAGTAILFNHESLRRSQDFFMHKIARALAAAKTGTGMAPPVIVNSLDFWGDWGSASEYMSLIADHLNQLAEHDFILATGRTVWARDLVESAFAENGIDPYAVLADVPRKERQASRPWRADISRFSSLTGRSPQKDAHAVLRELADAIASGS